jgi:glycosyltransferase involved in cell wall biosynthesis
MRILIFTQYYPPESGATQSRLDHFAHFLAGRGHDVTVIAEVPNHPKGVIFDGYRGRFVKRSLEDGVDTRRVWVLTSPRKSSWRRIAFYLSYAFSAAIVGLTAIRRRPQAVFASSPPLPVLLPAYAVSRARRCPLVVDIRDIWPAVGVALGEINGAIPLRAAQLLERFLYDRSAAITCVTRGFVRHVQESGISSDRIHYLPNGTVPDVFHPSRQDADIRRSLGIDGKFVVGYVGLHGIAQGLKVLIDAADRLRDRPDLHFLMVGEGPDKAQLVNAARDRGLVNITFHAEVPQREVVPYINTCDVMVVPLRKLDVFSTFIPSKLFDYLSCQRPVVLMVDGEARALLEDSGGGVYVTPEDSGALADQLTKLASEPDRLADMGRNGRNWVLEHFVRDDQAAQLETLLAQVAAS